MLVYHCCWHCPFSLWILEIDYLAWLEDLLALWFCFILLPSLLSLSSELSKILCGMVGRPGNLGPQFMKSSTRDPLLLGLCSQFKLWHTDVMPAGVPSQCAMAAFTLLTACSASPFDWGEYADASSWLIPASSVHAFIAWLAPPNWGLRPWLGGGEAHSNSWWSPPVNVWHFSFL